MVSDLIAGLVVGDVLSDFNDSSNNSSIDLHKVSRFGRVIKVPEKLDLFNQAVSVSTHGNTIRQANEQSCQDSELSPVRGSDSTTIPSKFLYLVRVIILLCTAVIYATEDEKTDCGEKEKALALIETAEDLLSKAKVFYPTCKGSSDSNDSDCGAKERSLAYIDIYRNLILEVKDHFPSCPKAQAKEHSAKDCSEILTKGQSSSGVYKVLLKGPFPISQPSDVFCDMDTEGGGWTVIQRRGDFLERQDFSQDWENYKLGFGKLTEEFWLGNEYIYGLTNQGEYEVRFDLVDEKGEHRYAVYDNFWIDDENSSYTLHIRNYSGDAGDSMRTYDGAKFSTRDKGDTAKAQMGGGGWWLNDSRYCNLNGIYKTRYPTSIHWFHWHKFDGLSSVEIKVRPR